MVFERVNELFCTQMEINIVDVLEMKEISMEYLHMQMVLEMKVTIEITNSMDMGQDVLKSLNAKGSIKMIKCMVLVFGNSIAVIMKVNTEMVLCMDMGYLPVLMVLNMKVTGRMISNMV